MGAKSIVGVIMYDAAVIPKALDFLVRNRARWPFDQPVSHTYPLEQINKALCRLGVARTRHHNDHAGGAGTMKELRRRLERERQAMAARLRQLGGSITLEETATPADSVWDEADHIQASEQRDMGLASRERLIERIERLTAALKRVEEGTYGTCVECGKSIAPARLKGDPRGRHLRVVSGEARARRRGCEWGP